MDAPTVSRDVRARSAAVVWIPVAVGLAALYVPTCISVYRVFWTTRDGAYGAVMLLLAGWLIWRERAVLRTVGPQLSPWPGWILLTFGLGLYVIGHSQSFYQLEVGSAIFVLAGIGVLFLGRQGLKRVLFPILLLLFVIPLPGSIADQLLLPLKDLVSRIVDNVLHVAGYPVARNGVVLLIGPYSLLIADACSGLNSMIALSGIGLLYVYLGQRSSKGRMVALLASILPIALVANILRVLTLVLITFYLGDGAGMSFHDMASYLEIAVAFGLFVGVDFLLSRMLEDGKPVGIEPVRRATRLR